MPDTIPLEAVAVGRLPLLLPPHIHSHVEEGLVTLLEAVREVEGAQDESERKGKRAKPYTDDNDDDDNDDDDDFDNDDDDGADVDIDDGSGDNLASRGAKPAAASGQEPSAQPERGPFSHPASAWGQRKEHVPPTMYSDANSQRAKGVIGSSHPHGDASQGVTVVEPQTQQQQVKVCLLLVLFASTTKMPSTEPVGHFSDVCICPLNKEISGKSFNNDKKIME